ncbi:MAG: hypothetical protein AAGC74_07390 [Verrucomicrobiota bacterium]
MRTSIDLPDPLLAKIREQIKRDQTTLRSFVIQALEKAIAEPSPPFKLRDASFGNTEDPPVSSSTINKALADLREPQFNP